MEGMCRQQDGSRAPQIQRHAFNRPRARARAAGEPQHGYTVLKIRPYCVAKRSTVFALVLIGCDRSGGLREQQLAGRRRPVPSSRALPADGPAHGGDLLHDGAQPPTALQHSSACLMVYRVATQCIMSQHSTTCSCNSSHHTHSPPRGRPPGAIASTHSAPVWSVRMFCFRVALRVGMCAVYSLRRMLLRMHPRTTRRRRRRTRRRPSSRRPPPRTRPQKPPRRCPRSPRLIRRSRHEWRTRRHRRRHRRRVHRRTTPRTSRARRRR